MAASWWVRHPWSAASTRTALSYEHSEDIFRHFGQYSPWFPAGKAQYTTPPDSCEVDQVSLLIRHGARFPTRSITPFLRATVDKLAAAKLSQEAASRFSWLNEYRYDLGQENLVPLGVSQSRDAGIEAFHRYSHLVDKGIFLRSSSSSRVQQSAHLWQEGFRQASHTEPRVPDPLVISDKPSSNDTLANADCPAWRMCHEHYKWAQRFAKPILERFGLIFLHVDLKTEDVIATIHMCAFESAYKQSVSPFCTLFSRREIEQYEYFQDLEKYYGRGYGNALGPVQGVGYVNELRARLTDSSVEDYANTNRTLDDDPATFPLKQGIYADFSHDNTMAAIVSALGLFGDSDADSAVQFLPRYNLPTTHMPPHRSWRFGTIAPFSGRIAFERLKCKDPETGKKSKAIRIIANDAPHPLMPCSSSKDGWPADVCSMDDFWQERTYARQGGRADWEKCRSLGD